MLIFENRAPISYVACIAEYKVFCTPARRLSTGQAGNGGCMRSCSRGSKNCILKFPFKNILSVFLMVPLFCSAQVCAKQRQDSSQIIIHFQNTAGSKLLQKDSLYQNPFGETFTIRTFKYYISNIVLADDNATGKMQSFPDQYFLVDEADTSSMQIKLSTGLNQVTSIHFLLGVDSIKNVSGVQTGTLDPAKGMFWIWSTGYIMAKLDGNSPSAKTPAHAFSYHVGGYKKNEKTERNIKLTLSQPATVNNSIINVIIRADINKWFSAINEIKISDVAFCHEPSLLATKLADNYANMFSVIVVK